MANEIPYGLPSFSEVPPSVWDRWFEEESATTEGRSRIRSLALGLVAAGVLFLAVAKRAE